MRKMIFSIVILLFLLFYSKYTFGQKGKEDLMCYTNEYNGIDTVLNIQGYFKMNIKHHNIQKNKDEFFSNCFIFYKDGFFLYGGCPQYSNVSEDTISKTVKLENFFHGNYILSYDTIKAQYFMPPNSSTRFAITKVSFKIVDSLTLEFVDFEEVQNLNVKSIEFIHLDEVPDSNKSWIKNKKWFWCDELDFKKWKRSKK